MSSSVNFENLRRWASNVESKRITKLATEYSQILQQTNPIENPNRQDIPRHIASQLNVTDNDNIRVTVDGSNNVYFLPREPDPSILAVWNIFENSGGYLKDYSFNGNQAFIYNGPEIIEGFDNGNNGGRDALRFNEGVVPGNAVNNTSLPANLKQYVRVVMKNFSLSTAYSSKAGIAYFVRMKQRDFQQVLGKNRRLFYYVDDNNVDNAFAAWVTSSGAVQFFTKRAGVVRDVYTAPVFEFFGAPDFNAEDFDSSDFNTQLTVQEQVWVDVWFLWRFSDNLMKIYISKDDVVTDYTAGTTNPTTTTIFPNAIADQKKQTITLTASNADTGFEATKAGDSNDSTSWRSSVSGAWLKADLGSVKPVAFIKLKWASGTSKIYQFALEISSDNISWATTSNGTLSSTGTTNGYELWEFPDVSARYVRIVGYGNNLDAYTQIVEFEVYGGVYTGPPVIETVPLVTEYNVTPNATRQWQELYVQDDTTSQTTTPYTIVAGYDISATTGNDNLEVNRERRGILVNATDSLLAGKKITKAAWRIRKVGSPTGTLYMKIWDRDLGTIVYTYSETVNVESLPTTITPVEFTDNNAPVLFSQAIIGLEYVGATTNDYIELDKNDDVYDGTKTAAVYWSSSDSAWHDDYADDLCATLYEGGTTTTTTSTDTNQVWQAYQKFKTGAPQIGKKLTKFEFTMYRINNPRGVVVFRLHNSAGTIKYQYGGIDASRLFTAPNTITITDVDANAIIATDDYIAISFLPFANESHSSMNKIRIEINDSQIANTNLQTWRNGGSVIDVTAKDIVGKMYSGGQIVTETIQNPFSNFYDVNSSSNIAWIELASGTSSTTMPYNVVDDSETGDESGLDHTRNRVGTWLEMSNSSLIGVIPTKMTYLIRKVGNPTGSIICKIWNRPSSTQSRDIATIASKDVSTFTTSYVEYTFENVNQTHDLEQNDVVGLEYNNGDASNYLQVRRVPDTAFNGSSTRITNYDGAQWRGVSRDLVGKIETGGQSNDASAKRCGEIAGTSNSTIIGKAITKYSARLKKTNTPAGTISVRIRSGVNDSIVATIGQISATSLTTSEVVYEFINTSNNYVMKLGDVITIEYDAGAGASINNKVLVKAITNNLYDGNNSYVVVHNGTIYSNEGLSGYDLAGQMFTGGTTIVINPTEPEPIPVHWKQLFINVGLTGTSLCTNSAGFNNADISEVRLYTLYPTLTEMQNLYDNRITISSIALGQVAELGYAMLNEQV